MEVETNRTNCILNKAVLKWDRKPLAEKTIDDMCTFFNATHKEELEKIAQGTNEANHAIALTSKLHQLESLSKKSTN